MCYSVRENYRPFGLPSEPGLLAEKIILKLLNEYDMVGTRQHAFCEGKSCLSTLLKCFRYVPLGSWEFPLSSSTKLLPSLQGHEMTLNVVTYRKAFVGTGPNCSCSGPLAGVIWRGRKGKFTFGREGGNVSMVHDFLFLVAAV